MVCKLLLTNRTSINSAMVGMFLFYTVPKKKKKNFNERTEAETVSETLCRYFYKRLCLCAIVCIYIGILAPLACCGLWVAVSLIATWVLFPWLLVFQGVCGCACALVCMQFLCFPGFLTAVTCAVAGSLIATSVWLASSVYVCMHPGKWLCG
jgi:hypothetical protein